MYMYVYTPAYTSSAIIGARGGAEVQTSRGPFTLPLSWYLSPVSPEEQERRGMRSLRPRQIGAEILGLAGRDANAGQNILPWSQQQRTPVHGFVGQMSSQTGQMSSQTGQMSSQTGQMSSQTSNVVSDWSNVVSDWSNGKLRLRLRTRHF